MTSYSEEIGEWVTALRFEDLPEDVVDTTKLRVLDVIGLTIAGLSTDFGRSVCRATADLDGGVHARIWGTGTKTGTASAAFANAALSQAMEFDDTHNESIVHMSGPAVATALAMAETGQASGAEVLTAVALGNEISCRVGCISTGQFHKRGFHPTGLFAPFGTSYLAGRMLGLTAPQLQNAAGIVGSFAAGLLECWVDGTQSKYLHPGWAAHGGIFAAHLAAAGTTGPATIFEGRFGLVEAHIQDPTAERNYSRLTEDLGAHWESRRASFKPYPAAHVIHPYIDALLRLRREQAIDPAAVREIRVPVAPYILPIVCEPLAEKRRPRSAPHGRVSMQYTLAEAMHLGELTKDSYQDASLNDPDILKLADRVAVRADESFPSSARFKGAVEVVLADGTVHEAVEEYNRGSPDNPMSTDDIVDKFDRNCAGMLSADRRREIAAAATELERLDRASTLVDLAIAEART